MKDKTSQAIAARSAAHPEDAVDRRIRETAETEERAQRAVHTTRAMQQRQQQAAAAESKKWMDWTDARIRTCFEQWYGPMFLDHCKPMLEEMGETIADEREARRREVKAAIDEERRASEVRLAAMEQRIVQQIVQQNEQRMTEWRDRYAERDLALNDTIAAERADRLKETAAAIEDERRAFEARLETMGQRLSERIDKGAERSQALSEAIAAERWDRQKEVRAANEETQQAIAVMHGELERRLKSTPGKMPAVKTWKPEMIAYQVEFISHEGALYQAKKDTATQPGSADWVCVARAGRDGRDGQTPIIRGTYEPGRSYRVLDIVALDGGMFIAKFDNPGSCPGNGWQLAAKQGKTGKPGVRGATGAKGPAIMPKIVSSKIEDFKLVVLREDKSLEIFDLRSAFEQYNRETSE